MIYRIFAKIFLRYIISSLSSSVLDILLFHFICMALKEMRLVFYVAAATVIARIVSATYNYLVNYHFVFNSEKSRSVSFARYAILAIVQMSLSAVLVSVGVLLLPFVPEVLVKIAVDTALFFISYKVQQMYVF